MNYRYQPYRPHAFAGSDAGQCDPAPIVKVILPAEVEQLKTRLDPQFVATDASAMACASLPVSEKNAWTAIMTSWRTFRGQQTGFMSARGDYSTACGYAKTLDEWQAKIAKYNCQIAGPLGKDIKGETQNTQIADLLRTGMYAAIALGGIYVAVSLVPVVKELLTSRRGK